MARTIRIAALPGGVLQYVYRDSLRTLEKLGRSTIVRASDVEPTPEGQWEANLARVDGPVLGPFTFREEALAAEVAWIERHALGRTYANP